MVALRGDTCRTRVARVRGLRESSPRRTLPGGAQSRRVHNVGPVGHGRPSFAEARHPAARTRGTRARSGSIAAPLTRTSKWRCAPVASPVAPTRPTTVPPEIKSPTFTSIVDRCAYIVRTPRPWATVTSLPQPPARPPAQVTSPGAAAITSVPAGAIRSMPAWKRSPRGPNPSPTGASNGHTSGIGDPAGFRRKAAIVAAPATPSGRIPLDCWNRVSDDVSCLPKRPSILPDGKPCQARTSWRSATSRPASFRRSGLRPSTTRPLIATATGAWDCGPA